MIDNMVTQRYPSLFNLPPTGLFSFIEGDVTSIDLLPVFNDAYAVIHLAALTDAAGSFDKATEVEQNNYTATLKIAEACLITGARLIAISSTSVYGTQKKLVFEDCSLEDLKPQSPYARTKLMEEKLLSGLSKEKGLKSIICRFGTIYGASPGMRFHTAVNKFCWQAVMGIPITVWRTALDQKRPYLDLSDAARAIFFILRNDIFDGKIYNILSQNTTVREIVEIIREFSPNLEVLMVDNEIMNQLSYEVSNNRFTDKGFKFRGDLQTSIGQTFSLLNFNKKTN